MKKDNKKSVNRGAKYKDQLWIILVFTIFVLFSITSSNDNLSAALNIIVLLVMLGFLLQGMGFLFNKKTGSKFLFLCTKDLKNLTQSLKEFDEEQPGLAWNLFREQENVRFECKSMEEAVNQFNLESDALYEDEDSYQCDIADYINEDLILTVGNAQFNDFVSNVMTGLGILGTFIGLAIGLKSFDASTAEAMTNSIVPLIDGIKVAFYTSIFGVGFSLLYGTLYRRLMNNAEQSLDEFLETYYRCLGRKPDNDAMAKMLSYQQSQTCSLDQFAEQISVALGDVLENTLSPALNALPDQISQSMQSCLSPSMEALENNLASITSDLSNKLSTAQEEGVGTLIEKFVSEMNNLMGGQIDNLSKSIETICNWQEETISTLSLAMDKISVNYADLTEINSSLASSIAQLKELITLIGEAENSHKITIEKSAEVLARASESIELTGNEMAEITERSGEILDKVNSVTDNISNQEKNLDELMEQQITSLTDITSFIRKNTEDMKQTETIMISNFKTASENMIASAESLDDKWAHVLERSFSQFDSELAKALQHFSGTLTDLQEIVENTPGVVDDAAIKLQKESSQYLNTIANYQKEFSKAAASSILEIEKQISGIKHIMAQNSANQNNKQG